jgi:hypothetical protein
MVCYICLFCKKKYNNKRDHRNHIKKCEDTFISQIEKYKLYDKNQLLNLFLIHIEKKKLLPIEYKCDTCNKKYKSYNGLKYHILNQCERTNLSLNEKIKNKYNITNNKTHNNKTNICNGNIYNNTSNTNNTNNTNTNNLNNTQNNFNFSLIPYNKIKYDTIELDQVKNLIEIPGEAITSLTNHIFFNSENKNNHVIFCPNLKDNQIQVFTQNKFSPDGWEIINKKSFFEDMIDSQIFTLEQMKNFNEEEDNPLEIKSYSGFNNLVKELDINKSVKKDFVNKLNNLCYQNKTMIKNTRDKLLEFKKQKENLIK